jgi:hypothetical protein
MSSNTFHDGTANRKNLQKIDNLSCLTPDMTRYICRDEGSKLFSSKLLLFLRKLWHQSKSVFGYPFDLESKGALAC